LLQADECGVTVLHRPSSVHQQLSWLSSHSASGNRKLT